MFLQRSEPLGSFPASSLCCGLLREPMPSPHTSSGRAGGPARLGLSHLPEICDGKENDGD